MKAKYLCVVVGLLVALLLTACGGKGDSPEIIINSMVLAKGVTEEYEPVDPTTQFAPMDSIYAILELKGRPSSGTITAKWYLGSDLMVEVPYDLATVNEGILFSIGENTYIKFYIEPNEPLPVSTDYRLELYSGDTKIGQYPFSVVQ